MQIVIDIPDGCYKELDEARFPVQDAYRLVAWIEDGTPLPKGHGRLMDVDAFTKEMERRVKAATIWRGNATDEETQIRAEQAVLTFNEAALTAKNMPTIIKADKEGGDAGDGGR